MINDLQKILRNMPYTDMLLIASALDQSLPDKPSQDDIAKALAALATTPLGDRTDISKIDQDSLRKVFKGTRGSIKVRPIVSNARKGWHVEINGPYASSVVNEDLKTALDNLLDTASAAAALKG